MATEEPPPPPKRRADDGEFTQINYNSLRFTTFHVLSHHLHDKGATSTKKDPIDGVVVVVGPNCDLGARQPEIFRDENQLGFYYKRRSN